MKIFKYFSVVSKWAVGIFLEEKGIGRCRGVVVKAASRATEGLKVRVPITPETGAKAGTMKLNLLHS